MTDKELLELAAKAMQATKDPDFQRYSSFAGVVTLELGPKHGGFTRHWNPLTDDGDALRLAVKLKLRLSTVCNDGKASVASATDIGTESCVVEHGENPYAATRRAIVRAAAEIGKEQA